MLGMVIMIACAVLAYRYAEMEGLSGAFWAAMSVLVYLLGGFGLSLHMPFGGFLAILLQFVLLVCIRILAMRQQGQ